MRVLQALLILAAITSSMVFAQEPPPARVVISKIAFQEVAQNRSFIGTLYYDRISHVSSEVPGLVTRINVRTGDRITNGTPLVHLNTEILEKEILIHQNQIEQADLLISHSKKNYERMESLFKKGGIREKDYDDANFVYQEALLKKLAAETRLEKLLIQKRKSIIHAPFDGIILDKNVDSGDWVQQGKPLISIGSVNDLYISVPVAETLLKFISLGQSVPVSINAYDKELTGTIDTLSPIADEKTKNVFLKIRIPMLTKVAQNMSATVFISTGTKGKLAIIPRDALLKFQGKDAVYTIKQEKAILLPVNIVTYLGDSIGADNEHFTEGMPVVVDGNERLRQDQAVVIVGEH
ncbi:MAG: efflux RND transporter periplasmic adaptor subunit [Proteobacteria bacterium]|nr:efflux RND transporter periplasmic adaptor subunit [Pseudomonadota bacterium]MBU1583240.1 efflux RND transporter periplasmic adaptor subunit [Pseudomonadota bacterium]MBU2456217.1 efflux RND transporter periplasmic adaptor subunit [Pseudomonadota bacterium]MBU2627269.1 efflux RND transporter periplasmic adaptor subunit [Pseudomonadota bacterium]